ncbi:EboA domain-containing protein [Paraglaciecola sp.]|uniref:EboA domain-containing protein n=1 Tax=Paraglaciecola sp. TaxID=1920173 RepID=UPI003EF82D19
MSAENILKVLGRRLSSQETTWLNEALEIIQSSDDPIEELLNLSVVVKRKITSVQFIENEGLLSDQVSDLVRICLLAQVLICQSERNIASVGKAYYQAGDSSEKSAFLKGLSLLDPKGEAVRLAVNAARCNSQDEFSALALNNDYPSQYFEDLNFNQLVLKALFMGLPIVDLKGLDKRLSVELSNMCFSYAVEQALAERIPPASLWLAVRYADLTAEHKADFEQYIQHFFQKDEQHAEKLSALIAFQELTFIKL